MGVEQIDTLHKLVLVAVDRIGHKSTEAEVLNIIAEIAVALYDSPEDTIRQIDAAVARRMAERSADAS